MQNVAAFMYGNGVPVEKAVAFFVACIGLYSYYVSYAMKDWYSIRDNNSLKASICTVLFYEFETLDVDKRKGFRPAKSSVARGWSQAIWNCKYRMSTNY